MLLGSGTSRADVHSRLGLQFKSVVSGEDQPAIIIQPQEPVGRLSVKLHRSDGKTLTLRSGPVAAGTRKEMSVVQPSGKFSYKAEFAVVWGDGSSSELRLAFAMTRVGKLEIHIEPKDVDLDTRTLRFRMSNPAAKATLTITGTDGKTLHVVRTSLNKAPAGTTFTMSWPEPKGDVLHMELKVTDVAGFWTGVRITPFSIAIPHDDVEFDFGKWDIRPSEEPKLEKTLERIREAVKKFGGLLEIRLYVAGYTDTVGSKPSNQTLSNNRARAIASWFRTHGLKIPIYYQGFGEEVLAKDTPDETREQANRRALYILSSHTPPTSRDVPRSEWKSL